MKNFTRLFSGMAMLASSATMMAAVGSLNINGVDQHVDTIIPKHNVGPGTTYAFYHLPNRPLTIHVTEIDISNEYVQMEVCNGGGKAVASETPSNMYKRNDAPGHDMVAVFNGDFYHTSATDGTATGMSRMGLIINEEVEINPVGMPMFVLTPKRETCMDAVHFSASIKSSKGATNRIHTLNSHYLEFDTADDNGERMVLYTPAYGTTTNATSGGTKVVIAPKEGAFKFAANTTFSCIVESINDNTGSTSIPAGKAVLYGTGANATFLQGLTVGEECTITIANNLPSNPSIKDIKEALGGSGHFLLQNGNVVISGNPDIHPRTFMGISQDKKIVYAVAVDGRWSGSAGVSLDDEGRILKWLGAWDGINLDGGGSTGMVVNGEYKNNASDGSERAVGNGMLVYSSAPVDDNVAIIEFEPRTYNVPVTARFRPAIYGFNQYGVLKTKDLENVIITCDANIGYVNENNEFIATQKIARGNIYAEYNGIKIAQPIITIKSPLELPYDNYIVDNRKAYPVQMNSQIGNFTYPVDAASVDWTITDATICSVADGKVMGIKNGTTTISGTSENFTGSVNITVEIPEGETQAFVPEVIDSLWTLKQTGGTGLTISDLGEGFKFNYTGNGTSRGAYFSATSALKTYSLPYAFRFDVNPGEAVVKKVSIALTNNLGERYTMTIFDGELTKNTTTTLNADLSQAWNIENNAIYPISVGTIRFDMGTSAKSTAFEVQVPRFEMLFGDPTGVESVVKAPAVAKVYPNPVVAGEPITIETEGDTAVEIYTMGGVLAKVAYMFDNATIGTEDLAKGMYVMKVINANGVSVAKLIIK
ncbi:MAG: phosphodiester glycosidase family protein [Muribaculaceae bacterium]|nr:phosphodiester glycosidase family protein [Muribaculaceae bacterium]